MLLQDGVVRQLFPPLAWAKGDQDGFLLDKHPPSTTPPLLSPRESFVAKHQSSKLKAVDLFTTAGEVPLALKDVLNFRGYTAATLEAHLLLKYHERHQHIQRVRHHYRFLPKNVTQPFAMIDVLTGMIPDRSVCRIHLATPDTDGNLVVPNVLVQGGRRRSQVWRNV